MLVRVLIVIVVVAVLGFFGTRGSEKVVAEVTERQEVVDGMRRELTALKDELREVRSKNAEQLEQSRRLLADAQRNMEQLQSRVAELEKRDQARDIAARQAEAVIPVLSGKGVPVNVRVNGVLRGEAPLTGDRALRLAAGEHLLELSAAGRSSRYTLAVTDTTQLSRIIVNGTTAAATGHATLTRVP